MLLAQPQGAEGNTGATPNATVPPPGDQADHDRGLALARKAMDAGDYPKAIELLNLVVEGWPQDTAAKNLLAQAKAANAQKGNYAAAMEAGRQSLNSGDYESAIARGNEALAARPGDKAAQNLVARANLRKNMASASPAPPPSVPPPAPKTKSKSATAPLAASASTAAPATAASATTPAPSPGPTVETPAPALAPADGSAAPSKPIAPAKATKNEISVSGDFFLGQGTVTLPVGFSLEKPLAAEGAEFKKSVASPDRSSTYYGGTISYSFNQSVYLDLSYARGSSSGNFSFDTGDNKNLNATFTIDDTWYQAYLRYVLPGLRGTRASAYLRGGFSYVTADLTAGSVIPAFGIYKQTDKTTDILGNIGFGWRYALRPMQPYRIYLQLEGEGFFGTRSQNSLESLPEVEGFVPQAAKFSNTLYGGIGRATLRVEQGFGKTGLFRVYLDGGFQAKYTLIQYSGVSAPNELLWGPYVKLGLRYSF
jgi:tetratricopeptide (TPR) repeat protein